MCKKLWFRGLELDKVAPRSVCGDGSRVKLWEIVLQKLTKETLS